MIPGLLEPDHKGIERYTALGREPYTSDPDVLSCVAFMFSKGEVAFHEQDEQFVGWIVIGLRPLAEHRTADGVLVVGYGNGGTIFPSYQDALDACVRSIAYATAKGWNWLQDGKFKIFNVVKREE